MGWEFGVTRGESSAKVIFEYENLTFGGVAAMTIWEDKLEVKVVFAEGFLHGSGAFVINNVESRSCAVLLEMFVARYPGFGGFEGLPVIQKLGMDGVGVVVLEDEYILVSRVYNRRKRPFWPEYDLEVLVLVLIENYPLPPGSARLGTLLVWMLSKS